MSETTEDRIRLAVRMLRNERRVTQQEMVDRMAAVGVEMTRSAYSQMEIGGRHISVNEVAAIAVALSVNVTDLFDGYRPAPAAPEELGPLLQVTVGRDKNIEIIQAGGRDGPALVAQLREIADTFENWERIRVL